TQVVDVANVGGRVQPVDGQRAGGEGLLALRAAFQRPAQGARLPVRTRGANGVEVVPFGHTGLLAAMSPWNAVVLSIDRRRNAGRERRIGRSAFQSTMPAASNSIPSRGYSVSDAFQLIDLLYSSAGF